MRRRLFVAGLLAIMLLAAGAAFADNSELIDKTPAGVTEPTKERVGGQWEAAVGGFEAKKTDGAGVRATPGGAGFSFFPEVGMPCSLAIEGPIGCGQALEPEAKTGPDGTIYVTAQEGTPAGVMAWRRDPGSFEYLQLAKPDGLPGNVSEATSTTGGGGDNELAIGTPDPDLGGAYRVYVSSLNSLVTNGVAVSTDRGDTWSNNPIASSFVGVDRQWLAAVGPKTAYLSFHEIGASTVLMTKTTDGGATWGPPMEMYTLDTISESYDIWFGAGDLGNGNTQSNMIALPDGGVAFAYARAAAGSPAGVGTPDGVERPDAIPDGAPNDDVWVAITDPTATTVQNIRIGQVAPTAVGLFPAIATDSAGNLYVTASNRHGVFLSTSKDRGQTWGPFNEVTAGARDANASTVFPYVVAGSPGRVGLAWLGTSDPSLDSDTAVWTVQYAYSEDGLASSPNFTVTRASTRPAHVGRVCMHGLGCTLENPLDDGRALAEVLQMGITRDGRVLVAYPEDYTGTHAAAFATVVEQDAGPGLFADITPKPPVPPAPTGPRVIPHVGTDVLSPNYFVNEGNGKGAGDGVLTKPGYAFDGATIGGEMSPTPGTKGHVGLIGYAANSTPVAGSQVVFTGPVLEKDTILGTALDFTLYIQNELGKDGATELDFTLFAVDAITGKIVPIAGKAVQEGPEVVGGAEPTKLDVSIALPDTWLLPRANQLVLAMSFPYLVSSGTRFYYGDGTYPAALTLHTAG